MNVLRIPRARLGSRRRFIAAFIALAALSDGSSGSCPLNACGTRLRFAPQDRQNLALSMSELRIEGST